MPNDKRHFNPHVPSACQYTAGGTLHLNHPENIDISPWRPGQALGDWWSQLTPSKICTDEIDDLIDGIDFIDKAESTRAYRRSILLLFRDTKDWLNKKSSKQSLLYPFINALHNTIRVRFETICHELIQHANGVIEHADISISRYQLDMRRLHRDLKQLPSNALEIEKSLIKKRIEKNKLQLQSLIKLKRESEHSLQEIKSLLTK